MGRWKPDAQGRLAQAALELYGERGFEQTTVADIAARAGLTERTFFRHFADKREVLFPDNHIFEGAVTGAVAAGLDAIAALLQERPSFARQRQGIISANPDLQERERHKLASLATGAARALRDRGVGEPAASLAAEAGIAVFRIAFARWVEDPDGRDLASVIHESLHELKAVTTGHPAVTPA